MATFARRFSKRDQPSGRRLPASIGGAESPASYLR